MGNPRKALRMLMMFGQSPFYPTYSYQKLVFNYTGSDQSYTVPPGVTKLRVKAWGAGSDKWNWTGAVGGYTEGILPVNPGDNFRIVVGQCGQILSGLTSDGVTEFGAVGPTTYGFGGAASDDTAVVNQDGGVSGGGLTGIFTGNTAVLATDQARARIIAGGAGGQVIQTENNPTQGRNGNSPSSGGQASMAGASAPDFSVERGGGGGGYTGGGISLSGYGGAGYVHGSVTGSQILFSPDGSVTVPNASDPDYGNFAGSQLSAGHGRLVIIEMP